MILKIFPRPSSQKVSRTEAIWLSEEYSLLVHVTRTDFRMSYTFVAQFGFEKPIVQKGFGKLLKRSFSLQIQLSGLNYGLEREVITLPDIYRWEVPVVEWIRLLQDATDSLIWANLEDIEIALEKLQNEFKIRRRKEL